MTIRSVRLQGTYFEPRQLPADDSAKVVLAGRSNVGKSSLINRLVNRRRLAKTSSTPGKTLSVNYYRINEQLTLVDLPGYGFARVSPPERRRVERLVTFFFAHASRVRLLLLLVDCRRGLLEADREMLARARDAGFPVLTILTKSDKISLSQQRNLIDQFKNKFGLLAIPFSIRSAAGRDEVWRRIQEAI